MKVYYWSPHLSKVATVKSVINSCIYLNKIKSIDAKIINVVGEWDFISKKYRIDLFRNLKIYRLLPKEGYFNSRLSSVLIFLISFFPLYFFLRKNKPDFLIVHLLTSIPIMLNNLFNLNAKIILRISGLPQLNFFRKYFWKYSKKKIRFITSPTIETQKRLIKIGIFNKKKIHVLRDPILSKQSLKFQKKNFKNRNKFLAIGRLTKQKNFAFLVDCFETILKINPKATLTIAGEGEERNNLSNLINFKNLEKKIKLVGYKKDVQKLYKTHDCFILSSLWEDPGFVLVEAASKFIPIISSDCNSGPKEISNNGRNMFIYKTNNKKDFLKKYKEFLKIKNKDLEKKCVNLNKYIRKFSVDFHLQSLIKLVQKYSNE